MRKVGTIYIETKYDITEWEWGRIRSRNHTDTLFLFVVGFFLHYSLLSKENPYYCERLCWISPHTCIIKEGKKPNIGP